MTSHAPFIIAAYLVAIVALGGLVVASVMDRRKVRREIAARGLERAPREQRARAS
jgi:heme exporter protein CcmD